MKIDSRRTREPSEREPLEPSGTFHEQVFSPYFVDRKHAASGRSEQRWYSLQVLPTAIYLRRVRVAVAQHDCSCRLVAHRLNGLLCAPSSAPAAPLLAAHIAPRRGVGATQSTHAPSAAAATQAVEAAAATASASTNTSRGVTRGAATAGATACPARGLGDATRRVHSAQPA